MCEPYKNSGLIHIGQKTNETKYEFLRTYYTLWNQITKGRPRIIVDAYAGSGIVELIGQKDILNSNHKELIFGSPLLAILKTIKLSNNLTIILNESNPQTFNLLEEKINDIKQNGIRIFKKVIGEFKYKSLETKRLRKEKDKKRDKQEYIFPEKLNQRMPLGYEEKKEFTKAKIILRQNKIENIIDQIISEYIKPKIVNDVYIKPIILFLLDPCGMISWNDVILKICELSNKEEGTEMILNWSWDAISRNLNTESKNQVLSTIYGIPKGKVEDEFKKTSMMRDYLKKYMDQIKRYFKHVVEIGVSRDRKLRPKQSDYKKYFLIFCTNNESALSLAGYKKEHIKKILRNHFLDLKKFAEQLKLD